MNHQLIARSLLIFPFLFLSACVSVSLKPQTLQRAQGVKFNEPASPFRKINNETVDIAWQSTKTGNTLAYSSECQNRSEISLDTMEQESLGALMHARILHSQIMEYNDREAKDITAEGFVDGIPIKLSLTLFKKNDCNYTLSFVGRKKYFDSEFSQFKKFKENFKAP